MWFPSQSWSFQLNGDVSKCESIIPNFKTIYYRRHQLDHGVSKLRYVSNLILFLIDVSKWTITLLSRLIPFLDSKLRFVFDITCYVQVIWERTMNRITNANYHENIFEKFCFTKLVQWFIFQSFLDKILIHFRYQLWARKVNVNRKWLTSNSKWLTREIPELSNSVDRWFDEDFPKMFPSYFCRKFHF